MRISTDIFIMGIILGWGPCLTFCAPVLIPYIAATQSGWLKGLRAVLVFSASRIVPYMLLGLIASSLGQLLIRRYYEKAGLVIYFLAGLSILIIGILLLMGKSPYWHFCQRLGKYIIQPGLKGLILLGLLVGLSPCVPLFGVLTYIAFVSKNVLEGLMLGACFGIGTALSPLIIFGLLAGGLPPLLFRRPKIYEFFSRLCGLFLVYLGAQLVIKVLLSP